MAAHFYIGETFLKDAFLPEKRLLNAQQTIIKRWAKDNQMLGK